MELRPRNIRLAFTYIDTSRNEYTHYPKDFKPKQKAPRKERPQEEPASPRTVLVAAYRDARIAQQEKKRQKYASWFS